jgi:hypothetical protein
MARPNGLTTHRFGNGEKKTCEESFSLAISIGMSELQSPDSDYESAHICVINFLCLM